MDRSTNAAPGQFSPEGLSRGSRALIDATGSPSYRLYAIGPVRKGNLWETIAVPELRTHASQLAEHLARTFELRTQLDFVAGAMALPANTEEPTVKA